MVSKRTLLRIKHDVPVSKNKGFTKEMFAKRLTWAMEESHGVKPNNSQLAEKIKVQRQTIEKYRNENNMNAPTASILAQLAEHLDVSADFLLNLSDVPSRSEDVQQAAKTLGISGEAVEAIMRMTDNTRKTLETVLQDYTQNPARNLLQALTLYLALPKESDSLETVFPAIVPKEAAEAIMSEGIQWRPKGSIGWNTMFFNEKAMQKRLSEAWEEIIIDTVRALSNEQEVKANDIEE